VFRKGQVTSGAESAAGNRHRWNKEGCYSDFSSAASSRSQVEIVGRGKSYYIWDIRSSCRLDGIPAWKAKSKDRIASCPRELWKA
jgi:hypothetical protein